MKYFNPDAPWHANGRRVEGEDNRLIAMAVTDEMAELIVTEHAAASKVLDAHARGCVCHSPKEPPDDDSNSPAD